MPAQQSIANFIGRDREIAVFQQWLADARLDAPKILYLYDALEEQEKKGGAGKTWLLRRYAQLAEEQRLSPAVTLIDFFDVTSRDGITIARSIVETVEKAFPQWTASDFTEALKRYDESKEQRIALTSALATDLKMLQRQLTQAGSFVLVMFDTTELVEKTPSIAVLNLAQVFPDTYQFNRIKFVIASRNKIDWNQPNWLGRKKDVLEVPVEPFSQQEMLDYLLRESIYSPDTQPEQLQALYKRTEGRPILIGLVADVLNNHVISIEDLIAIAPPQFESHLVLQIQQMENPVNWVVLFMAHVYHRFNGEILQWILTKSGLKDIVQDLSHEALMDRLPDLSFVRISASGDYLVLHDEMRRLVNTYCWEWQDPERNIRKDISQHIIEYFKHKMQGTDTEILLSEQERQLYIIEILFHTLFLDSNQGLQYFREHFSSALKLLKRAFARSLLRETLMFKDNLDEKQQRDLQLREAELLHVEDNAAAALDLYQEIAEQADPEWLQAREAEICLGKARCYLLQNKFKDAIENLERSLTIEQAFGNDQQIAAILNLLGFAHRNQGRFDKAQQYYEQGLAFYAKLDNPGEYANMINNLSNIDRLRGKTQIGLRHCQVGLNIRKQLFQAGKGSEYYVALSMNTMGLILLDAGHFVWGNQWFQQAYEIFLRLGHKRELARLYNRFGQIDMAKYIADRNAGVEKSAEENYASAKNWFQRAEAASIEIDNMEAYINSLNKQGRLLMEEKQWSEAIPFFEKAIKKAGEVQDDYQRVENLVDLAHALYRTRAYESAEKILQEVRSISEQGRYDDMLGRVEEFLGNISYEAGEYQTAFVHYRQYCRYMALRNDVEYNRALALIIDNLYKMPKEDVEAIIADFIAYWTQENMDGDYPDLKNILQDINKARFLEQLLSPFPPLLDT